MEINIYMRTYPFKMPPNAPGCPLLSFILKRALPTIKKEQRFIGQLQGNREEFKIGGKNEAI
jgi:hypothetical protein